MAEKSPHGEHVSGEVMALYSWETDKNTSSSSSSSSSSGTDSASSAEGGGDPPHRPLEADSLAWDMVAPPGPAPERGGHVSPRQGGRSSISWEGYDDPETNGIPLHCVPRESLWPTVRRADSSSWDWTSESTDSEPDGHKRDWDEGGGRGLEDMYPSGSTRVEREHALTTSSSSSAGGAAGRGEWGQLTHGVPGGDWFSWDAGGTCKDSPLPYHWQLQLPDAPAAADGAQFQWDSDCSSTASEDEGHSGLACGADDSIWAHDDVAEEIMSRVPLQWLHNAALVCRAFRQLCKSDLVWKRKLAEAHLSADEPGPLPLSPGPRAWKRASTALACSPLVYQPGPLPLRCGVGQWRGLFQAVRQLYSEWRFPLQLHCQAEGQSSSHGIFGGQWTLSDMHWWCSKVLPKPSQAEEHLTFSLPGPWTVLMAVEVVPSRKTNFVIPARVSVLVGPTASSFPFSCTFPLEACPVSNLLKLPKFSLAAGSHVRLVFSGAQEEPLDSAAHRRAGRVPRLHYCIKRVRFMGVPRDAVPDEGLRNAFHFGNKEQAR